VNIRFDDRKLERMAMQGNFDGGFDRRLAESYRDVIGFVVRARDERDLYQWKALRFEKLKGKRSHQRSMRLNRQFRLIVEMVPADGGNVVAIKAIEDYH
jgi:proteic killer suppression protein